MRIRVILLFLDDSRLHDRAATPQAVWADRARALTVSHIIPNEGCAVGADKIGRVIRMAECNIDEIFFPADWAIRRIGCAHLSRTAHPECETISGQTGKVRSDEM